MSFRVPTFRAADVRSRLLGSAAPADPSLPVLPQDSRNWPADFVARAQRGFTPAGVLVPMIERVDGLTILFTERSDNLKLHAGQISFPGGRMEEADQDIVATALREAHEEVGIEPGRVDVLGYLDPSATITGYSVTPVIGLLSAPLEIRLDPSEVKSAFEVPLEFLLQVENQQHSMREFHGTVFPIVEYHYAERRIWGATASMIVQLTKILLKQ